MLNTLIVTLILQASASSAAVSDITQEVNIVNSAQKSEITVLPLIEVRSQRQSVNNEVDSSLSHLASTEIREEGPSHPNEIFDRVAGAWISRGSGQEHLTAIRSPVLTGAGACAAFMVLEDNVPTRPSGFCNVNQLFEVNIAQADRIDVLRGPGTVIYGSNALHGVIDVLTPGPAKKTYRQFSMQAGTDEYYRGMIELSGSHVAMQANYTDAGSFRDAESYQHGFFNLQIEHQTDNATGRTSLAYASLDQLTAGYIPGKNAYKDELLRTQNFNPDAFRDAWAARASSRWNKLTAKGTEFEFIPYARSSRMEFLQHFLPGTPLEDNAQNSAGLLFSWLSNGDLSAGVDVEWAEGSLVEYQQDPIEQGSAFLRETRPQGFHYNYEVSAATLASWIQWQHEIRPGLMLTAGLRVEYLVYDYNNLMLDGNTRDDGTECGFGGCLYTRPADRSDSFTNVSPEVGLAYNINDQQMVYLRLARGFRAPQATELYRLQNGQSVADLDSEILNAIELGIKGFTGKLAYEVSTFLMQKDNFIFRDANGFNISDGKTKHIGIESSLSWQASDTFSVTANVALAKHQYDFNRDLGRGEIILKGNQVDTAPPWLGGLQLRWQRVPRQAFEAEWVYQGDYFLDAANHHSYPGHSLINVRGWWHIGDSDHALALRLTNLLDTRYAERADYAFGNYRYFPGAGRRVSLEWQYRK